MKQQHCGHSTRLKSGHDETKSRSIVITLCLLPVLLLVFGNLRASPTDLDLAVQKYHAGYPEKAIAILKPLALKGDMHAQNLLGNIVYALVTTDPSSTNEDSLKWYRMAAAQGSPEASYALGVIFNNRWLQGKIGEHGRLAEYYYQQAFDRGYARAEAPLMQMAARNHANRQTSSLKYSNSSFSIKRESPDEAKVSVENESPKSLTQDGFAGLELSGDPIADSAKLEALLQQISDLQNTIGLSDANGSLPDEAVLTRMLINFGVSETRASGLAKLLEQFNASGDQSLPAAN
jgi:hypothetical protein